jgi:hypothetical protein
MRLCEVKGCTRPSVGLVRVQPEGWRVPESRRVCTHHHKTLTPKVTPMTVISEAEAKLHTQVRQARLAHEAAEDRLQAVLEELSLVKQQHTEVEQALRAVLVEVDGWHTEAMVSAMPALQAVAALRKHHLDTVERYTTARRMDEGKAVALDLLHLALDQNATESAVQRRVIALLINESIAALEVEP